MNEKTLFGIGIILITAFMIGCTENPECTTAADCEGKPHPMCVGEWSCEESKCVYKCSTTECETDEDCPAECTGNGGSRSICSEGKCETTEMFVECLEECGAKCESDDDCEEGQTCNTKTCECEEEKTEKCVLSLCDCKCHKTPYQDDAPCGINCRGEYGVTGCEMVDGECEEEYITEEDIKDIYCNNNNWATVHKCDNNTYKITHSSYGGKFKIFKPGQTPITCEMDSEKEECDEFLQKNCSEDLCDYETEGFCGTSTNASCQDDTDCQTGGCSGQVCEAKGEGTITTCEWRECYDNEKYGLSCQCINNKCQWSENASIEFNFTAKDCNKSIDPYSTETSINKTTWKDNNTLEIKAYAVLNCAETPRDGDYQLNEDKLALAFEYTPCNPCTSCMCVHELVYTFENIEKKDYTLDLYPGGWPRKT